MIRLQTRKWHKVHSAMLEEGLPISVMQMELNLQKLILKEQETFVLAAGQRGNGLRKDLSVRNVVFIVRLL